MRPVKLTQLGEFGLIDLLEQEFARCATDIEISIGDDTAAWRTRGLALATTDTLVQDVHFRFGTTSWRDLGWKSLAVNLSDVGAMGGQPQYALLTFGLNDSIPVEGILEVARGLADAGCEFAASIVGGDIVASPRAMFITVALYGLVPEDGLGPPLRRSTARPGDLVAVTGGLGRSAAGLRLLSEGTPVSAEVRAELVRAHNRPWPRVREGQVLRRVGVRTAIDISDGLAGDVGHIARWSGVGVRLAAAQLPVAVSVRVAFPADALSLALFGGEEYELVFVAHPDTMDAARAELALLGTPSTVVGEITAEPRGKVVLLSPEGRQETVERGGYDHFRG